MKSGMKILMVMLMLAGTMTLGACCLLLFRPAGSPRIALSTSAGLSIDRVRALSELTTLKVDVADALATEIRGYTGNIKAVLLVRGDLTIGVDLSAAKFASVNEHARKGVLEVPKPKVLTVRLDHERTKLLGIWSGGLWTIVPGGGDADTGVVNQAFKDAQRTVATAAGDPVIVDRSKRQAEQVLTSFFKAIEWDVEVRWLEE